MRSKKRLRRFFFLVLLVLLILLILLPLGIYLGVGPALACRFPEAGPLQSGISARVLTSSGVERCYLLYTPPSYEPTDPAPVVFSLHGFAGTPQGLRTMTGWDEVADQKGFLVVYPHGSSFPLRWNTHPSARIDHIDDVQFIRDMLADLVKIATVDEARVYVTGFSNGGSMADQIACELADRIAAVGMVSGSADDPTRGCNPSRPVPIIGFFGTEDPLGTIEEYPLWFLGLINVSPSVNDREVLPLEAWIDGWVTRNGCSSIPVTLPATGDASAIGYTDCRGDADVVIYYIEGGGHTWPGGSNLAVFGKTSANISASGAMWEFFESHPMNHEP